MYEGVQGNGGVAPLFLSRGSKLKWEANFTPPALYPWEQSPIAHWVRGWVDPTAGLDVSETCPCLCFSAGSLTTHWHGPTVRQSGAAMARSATCKPHNTVQLHFCTLIRPDRCRDAQRPPPPNFRNSKRLNSSKRAQCCRWRASWRPQTVCAADSVLSLTVSAGQKSVARQFVVAMLVSMQHRTLQHKLMYTQRWNANMLTMCTAHATHFFTSAPNMSRGFPVHAWT